MILLALLGLICCLCNFRNASLLFWVISKASCIQQLKNTKKFFWSHSIAFHACSILCFFLILHLLSLDERKAWFLDDSIVKGGEDFVKMLKRGEVVWGEDVWKRGSYLEKIWNSEDHSEGEFLICFLVILLPFSELEVQFLDPHHDQRSIEQLFFHMDLKWDFWLFSGNWSILTFYCLISLADTILKPAWSSPLLSLANGPSCAFARKREYF